MGETAGGILAPLAERFHYGDLARLLDLPVLVVAGSKLGVINHTLLTLEYLRAAGLRVVSVVLNHPYDDESPAVASNLETLRQLAGIRVASLPNLGRSDSAPEALFESLATDILASATS
jgi:dethiobiotin synthetase